MNSYSTRQRTLVLAFMQRHTGRAWTAAEVHHALGNALGGEVAPSRSTVFRLLRRLSQEGVLMRLTGGGGGAHTYQMDGHAACADALHLKCGCCGTLKHLTATEAKRLNDILRRQLQFELDHHQAMLYGRCSACVREQGGANA